MAGTKAGGLKASLTNQKRFGKDFYRAIGRRGGQNASNPALARIAGAKGGKISKRGPAKDKRDLTARELEKAEEAKKLDAILEKLDKRNLEQN